MNSFLLWVERDLVIRLGRSSGARFTLFASLPVTLPTVWRNSFLLKNFKPGQENSGERYNSEYATHSIAQRALIWPE